VARVHGAVFEVNQRGNLRIKYRIKGNPMRPHPPALPLLARVRDGNWWRNLKDTSKVFFMTGFFDGMVMGNEFSYWGVEKDDINTATNVASSYSKYADKYLTNVTSGQLVDGLDTFYSDFRNRRIKVSNGVWIVVNQIAGKPEPDMQRMVESFRKYADKD
jgi:hypothetical protein